MYQYISISDMHIKNLDLQSFSPICTIKKRCNSCKSCKSGGCANVGAYGHTPLPMSRHTLKRGGSYPSPVKVGAERSTSLHRRLSDMRLKMRWSSLEGSLDVVMTVGSSAL